MVMVTSVAVFGAASPTGECVVGAAVNQGLKVRVLVDRRSARPRWLGDGGEVEVVEGDNLDIQDVKATLEGMNAAVVLLATDENQDSSGVTCEGLKNIVAVMELLYIKVVSVYCPVPAVNPSDPSPGQVVVQEDSRIAKVLESSGLHWVAVVSPDVTDAPATGYSIVRSGSVSRQAPVSRQDLAAFLLDCLGMPERYQKTVQIASFAKR